MQTSLQHSLPRGTLPFQIPAFTLNKLASETQGKVGVRLLTYHLLRLPAPDINKCAIIIKSLSLLLGWVVTGSTSLGLGRPGSSFIMSLNALGDQPEIHKVQCHAIITQQRCLRVGLATRVWPPQNNIFLLILSQAIYYFFLLLFYFKTA